MNSFIRLKGAALVAAALFAAPLLGTSSMVAAAEPGTHDDTFGGESGAGVGAANEAYYANDLAVTADDDVYVSVEDYAGGYAAIGKYDQNGNLDTSFGGGDGFYSLAADGYSYQQITALAPSDDRGVYFAATQFDANEERVLIGQLDHTGEIEVLDSATFSFDETGNAYLFIERMAKLPGEQRLCIAGQVVRSPTATPTSTRSDLIVFQAELQDEWVVVHQAATENPADRVIVRDLVVSPVGECYVLAEYANLDGAGNVIETYEGLTKIVKAGGTATPGVSDTPFSSTGTVFFAATDEVRAVSYRPTVGPRLLAYNKDGDVVRPFIMQLDDSGTEVDARTPLGTSEALDYSDALFYEDGSVVITGYAYSEDETHYDYIFDRLDYEGFIDTGFNGTGSMRLHRAANEYPIRVKRMSGSRFAAYGMVYTNDQSTVAVNVFAIHDKVPDSDPSLAMPPLLTEVEPGEEVNWEPIEVSDIDPGVIARIAIENGEYQVNDGEWSSTPGYVKRGDQISVRHISSSNYSSTVDTTLTVGGYVHVDGDTWMNNDSVSFTSQTMAESTGDGSGSGDSGGGGSSGGSSGSGGGGALFLMSLLLIPFRLFAHHSKASRRDQSLEGL